ncbi:MAG TPA: alpha/beta fold hydrolase [Dermatophilaceae bacterium]|nr:alpha/beta fold hydrolase [Dermatophilaceae bacterium]
MTSDSPWDIADRAAGALAPESDLVESPDTAEFGRALGLAMRHLASNPTTLLAAATTLTARLAPIPALALTRWLGRDVAAPVPLDPKDRRFSDAAWTDNPWFYSIRVAYNVFRQLTTDLVDGAGLDPLNNEKAHLAVSLMADALAPTNFLATNPAALKRAFDTGGKSLTDGALAFLDDLLHNNGRPRQVDTSPFVLGENLAATPAKVVYRNELMEVLQYAPQTPQVHAAPLLCSPPWINKYYVMDLAPGRSFIEWAVRHNRTVFAISYRNPSAEMSAVTMDDYLINGPHQALDVIQDITGAETVDIVGLCLGGAMTAITAAYLSAAGDTRVGNLTLLNTLLDYSEPGALRVFTDARTVDRLEKQMAKEGHLKGASMAGTFDVLRANDLIFSYVVSNWLMGQKPPAFDILAWNADSTRMPAAMHSFYLRNFYVENRLAKGELELAGEIIRLDEIKQQTYVVGAENDHIVPWSSAYAATRLLSGPVRFILSSGGHIAGIVNPPSPKGWFMSGDDLPATAAQWREQATRHAGSWWVDWATWSSQVAGPLVDPPLMGSERYPVLYDGPGQYIHT